MPIKMGATVQSVVIGDSVYIGRGDADNLDDSCTVMKLNLQRDEWSKLPQYSAKFFAMVSLANQLVLVGGLDPVRRKPINQIALFTARRWINAYQPMTTARHSSTAVCFDNCIIVAGGWDGQGYTSSVEMLDVETGRWLIRESLPSPRNGLKSTVIGNTLYLMGGWDHNGPPTKVVHKVYLYDIIWTIISSKEAEPAPWQVISDTPLKHSTPLSVGGSLLAVGGWDDHVNPSSSIHLYQPDTRKWVKVGDLPTAHYSCTCSVLPSGDVIVAGGCAEGFVPISTTYFLSISNAY